MTATNWKDMTPEQAAQSLTQFYGTKGATDYATKTMRPRVERMKKHWAETAAAIKALPFVAHKDSTCGK